MPKLRKVSRVSDFREKQQRVLYSFDGCRHIRSIGAAEVTLLAAVGDSVECVDCTDEPGVMSTESRHFWMRVYESAIRAGAGSGTALNYADTAVAELEQR